MITKAREFSCGQHEDTNGFNMRLRNYSWEDSKYEANWKAEKSGFLVLPSFKKSRKKENKNFYSFGMR